MKTLSKYSRLSFPSLRISILAAGCLWCLGSMFVCAAVAANEVEFSHERGIHSEGFRLKLTTSVRDADIYYTLDGGLPSEATGRIYQQPILIDKTTVVRAAVSHSDQKTVSVATHTYLFPQQVWKQPAKPKGYVRSAVSQRHGPSRPQEFDWAMDPELLSEDDQRSELLDALTDLPSLAVTLPVADFNFLYKHHRDRGVEFERSASIELIYPNKQIYSSFSGFQIDCGIRMHGGLAVDQARKKSFRVLFKQKYGAGKLEYPIFESAANHAASAVGRFDTLVLRAGGNGNWSKDIAWKHEPGMYLRDTLVRDSQIAMSGFGSRSTFVHLYLNGLYYGVFNVAERPDNKFMAAYFGGEREEYYSINHNGSVDGDSTRWDRARQANSLHTHVDVKSFCDYIILNWATGMGDWPWNNYYAGVRNTPPGSAYFFAWDAEHAFWTNRGYLYSSPNGWVNPFFLETTRNSFRSRGQIVRIWRALAENTEFKMVFADRVHRHFFGNGALNDENLGARFQRLVAQLDKAIVAESCRWGDSAWGREDNPHTRERDFRGNCRKVAKLIENNSSTFLADLKKHGLYPRLAAPALAATPNSQFVTSPLELRFRATENPTMQICVTLDGSDPRLKGGSLNPKAKKWSEMPAKIEFSRAIRVRARVKSGREWSAQFDETFYDRQYGIPLRITEIMYEPPNDDESLEFVELKNTSDVSIESAGLHFDGIEYLFPPHKPIQPKQVIVLIPNDDPDRFRKHYPGVEVYGTYRKRLSNEGERLAVLDGQGQIVTEVEYGVEGTWPTEAGGSGTSIHCDDLDNPDAGNSWRAAKVSPGTAP